MNASVPTALALAGAALMAVAIFGPFQRAGADDAAEQTAPAAAHTESTAWPQLVAASAVACDAAARIDLAEALGALQSAWSEKLLRQALEGEPDPSVRAAIAAALSSSQSLVT